MVIRKKCFNSYETGKRPNVCPPSHFPKLSSELDRNPGGFWLPALNTHKTLTTESICFENLNRTKEK